MNPKDLTNEELADILRAMVITGISPSQLEKECLKEAAERLEQMTEGDRNDKRRCNQGIAGKP